MLIKLFEYFVENTVSEFNLYTHSFIHRTFSKLMNEFGFRRVIKYNLMILPPEFFVLYENGLFEPDDDVSINYTVALAVVCISEKSSKKQLDKLLQDVYQFERYGLEHCINALKLVVHSMTKTSNHHR